MMIKKLALATLVAMGMSAAAIAQQPGSQPGQRSTQPSTQSSQPAPRGGDRTEQVSFERADKNADGRISREEGNDIDGFDFSRADTNNDASLSRQEFQAAMATSTPREGPGARNDSSARSGAAAGGGASARGPQSDQSASGSQRGDRDADVDRGDRRQRTAQVTFDAVDKDGDGKITRAEAADVEGLNFSSADTNADASLSRQEFQVAMAGQQPRG